MDTLRVLIVDDEEPARLRLRRLLEAEPDVAVVGECGSSPEAVAAVRELGPDLLFLDIRIPPDSGFAVLERLGPAVPAAVVFVTAYDEYAVRAFEAEALDYLLKPFSDARLRAAVARVRRRLREHAVAQQRDRLLTLLQDPHAFGPDRAPAGGLERLVVKSGSQLLFLDPHEVDWVEAEGVYVRLHAGGKVHLLRESLTHVEQRLDPRRFLRIHRSTILNVDRVVKIVPHFNGGAIVHLRDGTRLKMSRGYRDRVSATLG